MKTLTEQLIEKSNGLISTQPEVRDDGKGYLMFDDGGVEVETGEFLYGLVRILKPKHILETGVYSGISTMYMAQGLKDNKEHFENENNHTDFAQIFTCDIEQFHIDRAHDLWRATEVDKYILCKRIPSLEVVPSQPDYELMFLDSEPNLRFQELIRFFPYLKEGGYVGIHDVPRSLTQGNVNPDHPEIPSWPFGDLPEQIKDWLKTGKLVKIHFPNPRGMIFFYKSHESDYNP